jgi:catechol-2,3-dioxygenase
MGINVDHVHIKTKDPLATAKYYVDNFGARTKQEIPGRGPQSTCTGYSSTSPR